MADATIHDILKKHWGFDAFRPLQEDIIRSVLDGKDTLALLPTGGGKSLCFQVPGIFMPGVCIVVSPLIALMKDQVENLKKRGVQAAAIYSGMRYDQVDATLDNCIYGTMKFLYVSPERLQSQLFVERLKKMNVNLLAIDESHCISQWGYDFRPPYLQIAEIRNYLPGTPVLALTATATAEVVDDIQERLLFPEKNVFTKSFSRPNLVYVALEEEDKLGKIIQLLHASKGSAVVYVRNRKRTRLAAEFLGKNGISASYYHAGLDAATRSKRQDEWIRNGFRAIVATNAFGMGIDKPDVRLVVHLDLPDSLEAYFQEAGRGGRDEKQAYAVALYNAADIEDLEKNFETSYPPLRDIRNVYQALGEYFGLAEGSGENKVLSIDLGEFLHHFDIASSLFFSSMRFLEREGYASVSDLDQSSSGVFFHNAGIDTELRTEEESQVIKTILRSYEGVFDQFTRISEKNLANKTGMDEQRIISILKRLNRLEIFRYAPKKTGLSVTYMRERVPSNRLMISPEVYTHRKEIASKKIRSVISYVTRKDKCRSRLLLEYFGEKNGSDCGKCDVCRDRLTSRDMEESYRQCLEKISAIPDEHMQLPELLEAIPALKEQSGTLLRWLIDNDVLSVHSDQRVAINRKRLRTLL